MLLSGFELYPRWVPLKRRSQAKIINASTENVLSFEKIITVEPRYNEPLYNEV